LTFYDSDGIQRDFKWELSGPVLGVNLKINSDDIKPKAKEKIKKG